MNAGKNYSHERPLQKICMRSRVRHRNDCDIVRATLSRSSRINLLDARAPAGRLVVSASSTSVPGSCCGGSPRLHRKPLPRVYHASVKFVHMTQRANRCPRTTLFPPLEHVQQSLPRQQQCKQVFNTLAVSGGCGCG